MASYVTAIQTGSKLATAQPGTATADGGSKLGLNKYTSLSRVRKQLSLGSADTSDNALLHRFLHDVSRAIDRHTRRHFYPRKRRVFFPYEHSDQVKFGRIDVLEVKGLSDLNGASEVSNEVYFLMRGDDYNITPYDRLEILSDSGSLLNYSGRLQKAIHVDIIDGFREEYDAAWKDSGASLTADLGASITHASVSGSAGRDAWGYSPRFETEQIWRLSGGTTQEEYVHVLDTQTEEGNNGSIIQLIRGINGTIPASHASGTSIEVFDIEPEIEYCTRRLTQWVYQQATNPFTNTVAVPSMGIIEMPSAWPVDVVDKLKYYQRRKMHSSGF